MRSRPDLVRMVILTTVVSLSRWRRSMRAIGRGRIWATRWRLRFARTVMRLTSAPLCGRGCGTAGVLRISAGWRGRFVCGRRRGNDERGAACRNDARAGRSTPAQLPTAPSREKILHLDPFQVSRDPLKRPETPGSFRGPSIARRAGLDEFPPRRQRRLTPSHAQAHPPTTDFRRARGPCAVAPALQGQP